LLNGIKIVKFSYRPKVEVSLDGFDALAGDLTQVGTFRKEPSDNPDAILDRPLILGCVRSCKVGIGPQLPGNFLVFGPDASGSLSKVSVLMNPEGIPLSWLVI
jgi:hypothetical protein